MNIINNNISDHFSQLISVFNKQVKKENSYQRKRVFSSQNYEYFYNLLCTEVWFSVYEALTVDEKYNAFCAIICTHFNLAFPFKQFQSNKSRKPEWITNTVICAKETLNLLFELYIQNQIPKQTYNEYKVYYSDLVNQEKRKYYDNQISASDNKSKTIWNIIHKEKGIKKSKAEEFNSIKINNKVISSPSEASAAFNDFFVTAASNLIGTTTINVNLNHMCNIQSSMYITEVNEAEILEIIASLKQKNSSGDDGISNKMIKRMAPFILKPLTYIINASLLSGIFPSRLKTAVVKPLFKKGDSLLLENYRPISLLSSFSKVFEIAMCRRLISFLHSNDTIAPNQHGYQKGKSTTTAAFDFLREILEALCSPYDSTQ